MYILLVTKKYVKSKLYCIDNWTYSSVYLKSTCKICLNLKLKLYSAALPVA